MITFKHIFLRAGNRQRLFRAGSVCCGIAAALATLPMLTSCSDWDDHFGTDTSVTDSQRSSLWTNIESNPELKQFASLLKKTGYDELLNQSQTYTVWAPKDNTFDYDALNSLSADRVQRQFVENHIARNNYPASGQISENIYMLNKKVMSFASTPEGYTMQNVSLQLPSIGGNNGTIHQLNGKVPFLANLYESLNNEQFRIDSISDYFHSYDTLMLDQQRSVEGPAVNGEITYLDTVYTEYNKLYSFYNAYINREDSNYSMLIPTNDAWKKAKAHVSQFYQYPEEFKVRVFITKSTSKDSTIQIVNPIHLQDSVSTSLLLDNLFFNNRLYDNKHLVDLQDGQELNCDSLRSTMGGIFYADFAKQMLAGAKRMDKSNGIAFIIDEFNEPSWVNWCPPIKVEAENTTYLGGYKETYGIPKTQRVTQSNKNPDVPGSVSNENYLLVQPASNNSKPSLTFFLPGVRSATYHVYAVMLPSNITNRYQTEVKPNRVKFTMGYSNIDATSNRLVLKEEDLRTAADKGNSKNFETDPTKVDTLDLGEVTFPTSYVGLGENYPFIRIDENGREQHERTLRIDCIMLIPKELEDYVRNHSDQKVTFEWGN